MAKQNNGQNQNINQLQQVRREKLAALQEAGKNPFERSTLWQESVRKSIFLQYPGFTGQNPVLRSKR